MLKVIKQPLGRVDGRVWFNAPEFTGRLLDLPLQFDVSAKPVPTTDVQDSRCIGVLLDFFDNQIGCHSGIGRDVEKVVLARKFGKRQIVSGIPNGVSRLVIAGYGHFRWAICSGGPVQLISASTGL